jgi:hypothetical protein
LTLATFIGALLTILSLLAIALRRAFLALIAAAITTAIVKAIIAATAHEFATALALLRALAIPATISTAAFAWLTSFAWLYGKRLRADFHFLAAFCVHQTLCEITNFAVVQLHINTAAQALW